MATSASAQPYQLPFDFNPLPRNSFTTMVKSIGLLAAAIVTVVNERTYGSQFDEEGKPRKKGSQPPLFTEISSEDALADELCVGVRQLRDAMSKAKQVGLLEAERAGRKGLRIRRPKWENLPKLKPTRTRRVLPKSQHKGEAGKAERTERRVQRLQRELQHIHRPATRPSVEPTLRVIAQPAHLDCPIGMTCPVAEVFVQPGAAVTNTPPDGAEILRKEPAQCGTQVPNSAAESAPKARAAGAASPETFVENTRVTNPVRHLSAELASASVTPEQVQEAIKQETGDSVDRRVAADCAARLNFHDTRATIADFRAEVKRRQVEVKSDAFYVCIAAGTANNVRRMAAGRSPDPEKPLSARAAAVQEELEARKRRRATGNGNGHS